MTFVKIR